MTMKLALVWSLFWGSAGHAGGHSSVGACARSSLFGAMQLGILVTQDLQSTGGSRVDNSSLDEAGTAREMMGEGEMNERRGNGFRCASGVVFLLVFR